MADKLKYFKLGVKALSFYDVKSGLQLSPTKPGFITEAQYIGSEKAKNAAAQGHIIEIKPDEYEELMEKKNQSIEEAKAKANNQVNKQVQVLVNTHGLETIKKALGFIQEKQEATPEAPKVKLPEDTQAAADASTASATQSLKEQLQPKIDTLDKIKGKDLDELAKALNIDIEAVIWTKQSDKDKREEITDEFNDLK